MRLWGKAQRVWRQYLWRQFLPVLKSNPLARFAYQDGTEGNVLPRPHDPDATSRATKIETWAYVACNVLGKNLSAAPLIVEELHTVNSAPVWERIDTGPMAELVQRPNLVEPMDVLLWKTVLSMMAGDAYWIYDPLDNEVYHVHPKYVKRKGSGETPGFIVQRGSKTQTVEYEDMVHLPMPNNEDEFHGQTPIEPVEQAILTNWHYRRYLKNFFKSGAVPGGALVTDQSLVDEKADEMRREWNKTHGGSDLSHRTAILEAGLKYEQISSPIGDLLNDALNKMTREEILAVFGCPPVFAGVFEYANYANAKEQKAFLWENTILPLQRIIKGYLNIQLAPRFGDPARLRFNFDVSQIAALHEDETDKVKRQVIAVGGPILTPNEARRNIGYEPLEGGDELKQPQPQQTMNIGGSGGQQDDGKSQVIPITKINAQRFWQWDQHYKSVLFEERGMVRVMRKYFDDQLDRVLAQLDEISDGLKISHALLYVGMQKQSEAVDVIFDIVLENAALEKATDPTVTELIVESGRRAMREVGKETQIDTSNMTTKQGGISGAFDLHNPEVQTVKQGFTNRIKKVNDTTYKEIQNILAAAYDEGLGLDEVTRQLRDKYKGFSKFRAERIAKTETNGLVNAGNNLGYKQAGVTHQEWSSAFLASSRPDHIAADGQVVLITKGFEVGPDILNFPSDPNGSPGNVINCYCSINPIIKD